MPRRVTRTFGLAAFLAALPLLAADPPRTIRKIGELDAVLADLGENTLTIRRIEIDLATKSITRTGRPRVQQVERQYDYDLAPNVMFRRQELPKGKNGKAPNYSNEEYAELRAPLHAPGFKASRDDFKPGQMVRLFLGRETDRDRPVVTAVMLLRDTPVAARPPAEKPKKKDDKSKR